MDDKNLKLIKSLTADEVFETWRSIESSLEHWKPFWESRGGKSWEDWRKTTHAILFAKELKWGLYQVIEPLVAIPEWRGGMFHSWAKWFYPVFAEQPPRLKDLVAHPGINNHWYVREIAGNFKNPTTLTAVRLLNGDICVVEGMHRACAVALMANEKRTANIEIFVMLADWPDAEPPRLGNWENN